jgi:hypothetical protein
VTSSADLPNGKARTRLLTEPAAMGAPLLDTVVADVAA